MLIYVYVFWRLLRPAGGEGIAAVEFRRELPVAQARGALRGGGTAAGGLRSCRLRSRRLRGCHAAASARPPAAWPPAGEGHAARARLQPARLFRARAATVSEYLQPARPLSSQGGLYLRISLQPARLFRVRAAYISSLPGSSGREGGSPEPRLHESARGCGRVLVLVLLLMPVIYTWY